MKGARHRLTPAWITGVVLMFMSFGVGLSVAEYNPAHFCPNISQAVVGFACDQQCCKADCCTVDGCCIHNPCCSLPKLHLDVIVAVCAGLALLVAFPTYYIYKHRNTPRISRLLQRFGGRPAGTATDQSAINSPPPTGWNTASYHTGGSHGGMDQTSQQIPTHTDTIQTTGHPPSYGDATGSKPW